MNISKATKSIVGWLIAAIILYFLVRHLRNSWQQVASGDWKIIWPPLILSGLLLVAAYLTLALAWRQIIAGFAIKVPFAGAFRVMYLAQLGRYIPGKIWQVVGMIGLARQIGVPAPISLASFALGQIYFLPAAFIIIPFLLGNPGKFESLKAVGDLFYFACGLIVGLFLILFLVPGGLNKGLNFLLRLFKKEPVSYMPSYLNRLSIFILYLISWIFMGLSFRFFINAVSPEIDISYAFAAGTYIASYVIGYLSFIAPGGLGVREAVMAGILQAIMPFSSATLIALANRFWITLAETAISLIALLTYRFGTGKAPGSSSNQPVDS